MNMKTVWIGVFGLSAVILVAGALKNSRQLGPSMEAGVASNMVTAKEAKKAERALRAEPKIKDVLFQPGQPVEWQIGVLDDGTSRVGYANYVCGVLQEHGALKPNTHVRVVDIARVVNQNASFRTASLGHVACADGRVINP